MEVDEEVESKKKLDEQRKEELQEIEQKWNDLLLEHQRMQKKSQKLHSLQDNKKKCLKDAGMCEEEMEKVRDEIAEREAHFQELAQKSRNFQMAADDLEEEIRVLQAGEERRGSCASQSNGCCFDSLLEHLFTLGAAHARQQIHALQEEFSRRFDVLATSVHMAGREEEKRLKRSKYKKQPVAKWVTLFLILLSSRMEMVRAVEEDISNSPRSGPCNRDRSRTPANSPLRSQQQSQEEGIL